MKVRNKYLLIMATVWGPCLALTAACYTTVLRPQADERRQIETKVTRAKEHYARAVAATKPQNQARLTGEVDRLHDRVAEFLVDFEDATELAFEIGKLAHETRLESFGMKPAGARASVVLPSSEHIGEKHLNLSFLAGYTRFAAFLNALERHHPIVFVETFTINRPLEADAEPRVDMELAVLVEKPQGD